MTENLKTLLALIERSPDRGDGWRSASPVIFRGLVKTYPDQSLIEWKENDDGSGFVRLTDKGRTVMPYLGGSR